MCLHDGAGSKSGGTAPKAQAQLAVGLLCVSEPAGLTPRGNHLTALPGLMTSS